jgi:phosphopentomutase
VTRAFLIVMDSVGCGGAPDAGAFGDAGANTLAHIAQACAAGRAEDGRSGPLRMPVLDGLGLGAAVRLASGDPVPGLDAVPAGRWGAASEVSRGKDTPSGHWELAGVPVPWDWAYFPDTLPAFPPGLLAEVCRLAGTGGTLGNCHASGIRAHTSWRVLRPRRVRHRDGCNDRRLRKTCRQYGRARFSQTRNRNVEPRRREHLGWNKHVRAS